MKINNSKANVVLERAIIVVVLILGSLQISAQEDFGCEKPNKKAQKLYDKAATVNFRGEDSYKALLESTKEDPNFAEAFSVLAYLNEKRSEKDPRKAHLIQKYHLKTHNSCPAYRNYESALWLAKDYYLKKDFVNADKFASIYLSSAKKAKKENVEELETIQKQIQQYKDLFKNPVPFDLKVVSGASTADDEYLPMLSPDNQYLFFTRKSMVDTRSIYGKQEQELFIKSRKKYDGNYTAGEPMPSPFNKGDAQGGATISVDNKLMFITLVNQSVSRNGQGFNNGDIYYSELHSGEWSSLKSIGEHINGRLTWEGQPSISADNKTLYFASARPNGFGGMDLYKVERLANGRWGNPINLGPKINTAGNEKSPFMHSDSHTLYFSSDGHPGAGGQDIFFCHTDKFGSFTAPVNIGIPINTKEDEHGFMVSTDGRYGYFSSKTDNRNLDIFNFDLPEYARPDDVVLVSGSISSKNPEAAKGMTIELKNMATNEVVEGVVDEETGDYVAVVAASEDQDVMMMAKKNGYAFTSQYINSNKDLIGKPVKIDNMEFNPIETGETYKINNIVFETNSFELNQQVINILNEFVAFMKDNPTVKVAIQGHTDNRGDAAKNLTLSTNRAKAVFNYLILEDIDPLRLKFKGFGSSKPVADNSTEAGRLKNRRTEFVILSK